MSTMSNIMNFNGTQEQMYHLTYGMTYLELQTILDSFNSCNCCDRHSKKKPAKLEEFVEERESETKGWIKHCNCACRHNSRMLCRMGVPNN